MSQLRFTIKEFHSKCMQDKITLVASSLAYTSVLSLIPMIALAYFFLDFSGGLDTIQKVVEDFIFSNLAPSFGNQMSSYVTSVRKNISPKTLGVFGVIGTVYTSLTMLVQIEQALNSIWKVERARPWSQKITQYWTMMTLGPLLLSVSFVVSGKLMSWVKQDAGEIARMVLLLWSLVPYIASSMLFACVYIVLPYRKIHKKSALLSGVLTAFIFEVSKQAYGHYASHAIGKSVYGSLAVLPVFLLWLYWIWIVVLLGAEFCFFIETRFFATGASHTTKKKANA